MASLSSASRMAEFLNLYLRCIAVKKLSENSAKWFPKWFESYVRFHRFHTKESVEKVPVTEDLLVGFLKHLRDRKVAAWQRLRSIAQVPDKNRSTVVGHVRNQNQPCC